MVVEHIIYYPIVELGHNAVVLLDIYLSQSMRAAVDEGKGKNIYGRLDVHFGYGSQ